MSELTDAPVIRRSKVLQFAAALAFIIPISFFFGYACARNKYVEIMAAEYRQVQGENPRVIVDALSEYELKYVDGIINAGDEYRTAVNLVYFSKMMPDRGNISPRNLSGTLSPKEILVSLLGPPDVENDDVLVYAYAYGNTSCLFFQFLPEESIIEYFTMVNEAGFTEKPSAMRKQVFESYSKSIPHGMVLPNRTLVERFFETDDNVTFFTTSRHEWPTP